VQPVHEPRHLLQVLVRRDDVRVSQCLKTSSRECPKGEACRRYTERSALPSPRGSG
jgi:hypothetical protein